MDASTLRDLDIENYRTLLHSLMPEGSRFALADTDGAVHWGEEGFPEALAREAVRELGRNRGPVNSTEPKVRAFSVKGRATFAVPLFADGSEAAAVLVVLMPKESSSPSTNIGRSLRTIAACLSKDIALNSELDAMATELTERYEELNLVYHTEDQVNYFAEGQEALNQLVRNCCEYLDVALAAVIMRDKGLVITQESEQLQDAVDAKVLVDKMSADLYNRILKDGEPVVINDLTSPEALKLWHGMAYRTLAAPVLDSKGSVSGIIAIANPYGKRNFSNSDKNLLQVMARKAAKIVQVNYDSLTGLVNREGFEFFAERGFRDAHEKGIVQSILHVDIDQIHVINDTISHEAGDAVIQAVSAQIRRGVRDTDVVSRLGGDELGILLRQCPLERATEIADKLRESVCDLVIPWTDRSLTATVSVGVAPIDEHTETTAAALAAAELACGAAKELGKNRVQRYYHSDTALVRRHQEMESVGRIQTAIKEDRFELYGQLIAPLAEQSAGVHLEVLLRMQSDDGEPLPPSAFLPAAERYHLMPDIDRWVIQKTLAYLDANWTQLAPQLDMIAINLSGQTLGEPGFTEFLSNAISGLRLPLNRICFEITETAAVDDLDQAREFMRSVKERGCRFALDDFGSGLSSFGYLRSLPVDYLKIDGSIVKEIARDEIAESMVAAVQHVATVMGLQTIAEFVEDDAIKEKLLRIGVSFAQGYGIAKPQPLAAHFQKQAENPEAVA